MHEHRLWTPAHQQRMTSQIPPKINVASVPSLYPLCRDTEDNLNYPDGYLPVRLSYVSHALPLSSHDTVVTVVNV
jgi:hypothetical protein